MKILKVILVLVLLPLYAYGLGWDAECYARIERQVQAPQFPGRTYNIVSFGAGVTAKAAVNQRAINKAIAVCSKAGGGRVVVPAGRWNTGAIRLLSNVNLVLEQQSVLSFVFDISLYPPVKTRWEGLDCMNYSPCIYAYGAQNVAVTGQGTIDGNGSDDTWWKMCGKEEFGWNESVVESQLAGRPELFRLSEAGVPVEQRLLQGKGLRPQLVNFYQCENILMENVTLLRSPFWVIHPLLSKNITIRGVKIWNEGPNGDGCDPESCENVLIEDCYFHTGDDCIAIKSGRNADGRLWNVPSSNIIVRNCTMEDGHGGVVIGSEISGGCNQVFVENCQMDSPNLDRVLRIKTNSCRGGVTEHVYMRNVQVGECREAVLRINLNYEPREAARRGFNPTVRNIYMENVSCGRSRYGVLVNGLDDADHIYNVEVKNCRFNQVQAEGLKRTGLSHDLKFENTFVNGSLLLAEQPFDTYSQWMVASEMRRVPRPSMLDYATKPRWSYSLGIELEAMLDTYLQYGGDSLLAYLQAYPAEMIDVKGNITGYRYADFNLDNVRTAKFLYRLNKLQRTENIEKALQTLFRQLEKQPRTADGIFWHKDIYANQVWLDGTFMGLPYYALAAPDYKKGRKLQQVYDDVVAQVMSTDTHTYDATTGLWKHAWDATHSQFWADSATGQSRHTWARALGWYAMALVEVLEVLPAGAQHDRLVTLLQKVMTTVVQHQEPHSGVWYDVLDVADSRNYLEATASCMFAYVLLKGGRLGYLPASFQQVGRKAYAGILKAFVRVNSDSTISLTTCCAVSGLGPGPGPKVQNPNYKRDGSFEYYMSEPVRDNDAKGIGPFLWASLEMERLQSQKKSRESWHPREKDKK